MAATLKILNSFILTSQGVETAGHQGLITDDVADSYSITAVTIAGTKHDVQGSLATATVVTVFDDDDDKPSDFDYLWCWADQDIYIQIIGSGSEVRFKMLAYLPFVLPGYDSMLATAGTSIMTGGSEPTLTDIDSVVLGNYSGNTANYRFIIVD